MTRWFKSRPVAEYRVFAQAMAGICAVRLLLGLFPMRSVRRGLWRVLSADEALPPHRCLSMKRLAGCISAAERVSPLSSTCLVTALVAEALFSRHGYGAQLRVGVQRGLAGAFAAHAWLEFQGSVVVGGPVAVVEQYTPLPKIERLLI